VLSVNRLPDLSGILANVQPLRHTSDPVRAQPEMYTLMTMCTIEEMAVERVQVAPKPVTGCTLALILFASDFDWVRPFVALISTFDSCVHSYTFVTERKASQDLYLMHNLAKSKNVSGRTSSFLWQGRQLMLRPYRVTGAS
jgi:hypothetical protein